MTSRGCRATSTTSRAAPTSGQARSWTTQAEASFGATYDKDIRQWLADDFTAQSLAIMSAAETPIGVLYRDTYSHVTGSHVVLLNYAMFGDLTTPIGAFTTP